jgi:hypothetical protein
MVFVVLNKGTVQNISTNSSSDAAVMEVLRVLFKQRAHAQSAREVVLLPAMM